MQFETFRPYGHATHRDPRQSAAGTFDYDAIAERVAAGLPPVSGLTKNKDGHWVRYPERASAKPATSATKAKAMRAEYLRLLRAS